MELSKTRGMRCRICGCSDYNACPGGCHWVEDNLCNKCEDRDEERLIKILSGKIPEFRVFKGIGSPRFWQVAGSLKWHCDPEKGIYREAKTGGTKIEALQSMFAYLKKLKII